MIFTTQYTHASKMIDFQRYHIFFQDAGEAMRSSLMISIPTTSQQLSRGLEREHIRFQLVSALSLEYIYMYTFIDNLGCYTFRISITYYRCLNYLKSADLSGSIR